MPIAPRMRTTLLAAGLLHAGVAVLAAPGLAGGSAPAPVAAAPPPPVRFGAAVASAPVAVDIAVPAPPARQTFNAGGRGVRTVESTAYCLDGTTASGLEVGPGHAAMNGVPLGTTVQLLTGPLAGTSLVVTDRIGHGSELDVWIDDCGAARAYGRVVVDVVLG